MRTRPEELEEAAVAAVEQALASSLGAALGRLEARPPNGAFDLLVEVNGRPLTIEIVALANGDPARLSRSAPEWRRRLRRARKEVGDGAVLIVVADQLPHAAKDVLRREGIGWLDRRGHLRIEAPGVIINDTTLAPLARDRQHTEKPAIRGRAALTVALLLLQHPDDPPGVRALAAMGGLAPSTVSGVLRGLREDSLIRNDLRPFTRDLFWRLADVWAPEPLALERAPDEQGTRLTTSSWAITGARAAAAWGAPVVTVADEPDDFYAPSLSDVRAAAKELGVAVAREQRRASVAAAPTGVVTTSALQLSHADPRWPVVHPVVAALDLARDRARGPELLDDWNPPPPYARVW